MLFKLLSLTALDCKDDKEIKIKTTNWLKDIDEKLWIVTYKMVAKNYFSDTDTKSKTDGKLSFEVKQRKHLFEVKTWKHSFSICAVKQCMVMMP